MGLNATALDPAALWGFMLVSVLIEISRDTNMADLAILARSTGQRAGYATVAGVAVWSAVKTAG